MVFQINKSSEFKDYIVRDEDRFSFRLTESIVFNGYCHESEDTGKVTIYCFVPDEVIFARNLGFNKVGPQSLIHFDSKKEATQFLRKVCKICEDKYARYIKFRQKLLQ